VAVRIARVGRSQAWPLTQVGQELLQQDIDSIYQVLINGIGTEYLEPDTIENMTDVGMGTIRVPVVGSMETELLPQASSMETHADGITG
jgi:hypothetical protein